MKRLILRSRAFRSIHWRVIVLEHDSDRMAFAEGHRGWPAMPGMVFRAGYSLSIQRSDDRSILFKVGLELLIVGTFLLTPGSTFSDAR